MQQVLLCQFLHDGIDAACLIQILHVGRPGGRQVAQVRRALRNLIRDIHINLNAGLMRDGGQMEHGIRGTSKSHVHGEGVHERILRHNVTRTDILLKELHDLHSRLLGKTDPVRIDRGDRSVSLKAHSQGLRQAVHAVGRIHAAAAAAGRTDLALILFELLLCDPVSGKFTDRLKHRTQGTLLSVDVSGKHGAPGDEDRRDVQPGRGHQKTGYVLVAVRNHDKSVKLMRFRHTLGGIRDQIARDQGILHSLMSHCDSIADSDRRENPRNAAGHRDAHPDSVDNLVKVHMAGDNLIVGAHDSDQRPLHLFLRQPQGIEQRSVRGLLQACLNLITFHDAFLLLSFLLLLSPGQEQ